MARSLGAMAAITLHPQQHIVITERGTGRVLTGLDKGQPAQLREWTGAPNQQWVIENIEGRLRNVGTQLCLDVSGASKDDRAAVICWDDNGGANQRWRLQTLEGGGSRLLAGHTGKALTPAGGELVQDHWTGAANQRWEVGAVVHDNQRVAFRSHHGKVLSANPSGALSNLVTHVKSWEHFTLDRIGGAEDRALSYGDQVSLRSHHGAYLSAQPDGGLVADRSAVDSWERFTLTRTNGDASPGPIRMDHVIALRSHHGKWVMGHSDGTVNAQAPSPRSWEHWRPLPIDGFPLRFEHVSWASAHEAMLVYVFYAHCVRPAVGIEVDVANFFSDVGVYIAKFGASVAFEGAPKPGLLLAAAGGAIAGGAEIAKWIDSDRDQDDLFVRRGGKRIWPSGEDYEGMKGGDARDLDLQVEFTGSVDIELMDYDSGSADDVLGVLRVKAEGLELVNGGSQPFTAFVGSKAEDSLYELVYVVARA
ncbi:alpha-glucosidase [Plesiocystis pacifica SIR-1]|uniref:Alpha-glucosidase n=2 Tax=Plesiocystis pacifica TaxID=191768 RepID=A6FY56_9BACT|nr:alpha-glucosidase [Plesiocystis pacifica SIR-1]